MWYIFWVPEGASGRAGAASSREDSVGRGDERGPSWWRTIRDLQTGAQQAGSAASAGYSVMGAILLFGGIGYAIDAWRGTSPAFVTGGLILGVVVGLYLLAKTVWHR